MMRATNCGLFNNNMISYHYVTLYLYLFFTNNNCIRRVFKIVLQGQHFKPPPFLKRSTRSICVYLARADLNCYFILHTDFYSILLDKQFSIKKVSIVLQGQQLYPSFNLKVACVCLARAAYNTSHYPLATKSCTVLAFSGYCIAWGGAASLPVTMMLVAFLCPHLYWAEYFYVANDLKLFFINLFCYQFSDLVYYN